MIACPLLEHKRLGLFVCICAKNEFEGINLLCFGLYVKVALFKTISKWLILQILSSNRWRIKPMGQMDQFKVVKLMIVQNIVLPTHTCTRVQNRQVIMTGRCWGMVIAEAGLPPPVWNCNLKRKVLSNLS